MLKIDFGGGEANKYPDYEICDILKLKNIKYGGVDFNKDKLPFQENSIDEAICSHTLEHIEDVKNFLNELHRVIKKGAWVEFIVPYGLHSCSSKPVHKQMITECWFDFLRKSNIERVYGFKRWDIASGSIDFLRDKEGKIYELKVKITPIK